MPGDACTVSGSYTRTGGPELSGSGHMMVCDAGAWKSILSFNGSGQITGASNSACTNGQVLKFDGTKFSCADDNAGGGGVPALPCKADMTTLQTGDTCDDGSKFLGSYDLESWKGMYTTDVDVCAPCASAYEARDLCASLDRHGHTDWVYPSGTQVGRMRTYRAAIGGFTENRSYWFGSIDIPTNYGTVSNITTGQGAGVSASNGGFYARCARIQ